MIARQPSVASRSGRFDEAHDTAAVCAVLEDMAGFRGTLRIPGVDGAFEVTDEGAEVYLEARLPQAFSGVRVGVVTGADLPRPRLVDADFEERDGTPVIAGVDLLGKRKERGQDYPAGPIAALTPGQSRIRVW